MSIKPLFVLSLPRAGSTLMQRVLSKHPEVASASEPWVLLPLMYALREEGIVAEYGHKGVYAGVTDFTKTLKGGKGDYYAAVRKFALYLYEAGLDDEVSYFLDKTPRNCLIIPDLLQTFPDAKFIVLWRNPLAVAASIIQTFGMGCWNIYRFEIDLYQGLMCLLELAKKKQQLDNVFFVNYEDFVSEPETSQENIFTFLGLSQMDEVVSELDGEDFCGRLGDPTGIKKYSTLSTQSIDLWVNTFNSAPRKQWARSYLDWLGEDNLSLMGYDLETISAELETEVSKQGNSMHDRAKMLYGFCYRILNVPLLKKVLVHNQGRRKYPYY